MKQLPDYQFVISAPAPRVAEWRLNMSEALRSRITWQHWPFVLGEGVPILEAVSRLENVPPLRLSRRQDTTRILCWLKQHSNWQPGATVHWVAVKPRMEPVHLACNRKPAMEDALKKQTLQEWRAPVVFSAEEVDRGKRLIAEMREGGWLRM